MYLQNLHLNHFRNLAEQSVTFSPGFNYLYGANGAGKTAVLEGIHVLARGRSFRTHKMASVIHSGAPALMVRGQLCNDAGQEVRLGISKSRGGRTELRLNGQPATRASELAQHLPVQTLLPDAADLVLGGPGERRGFMDWGVFHVEHRFVDVSRNYRRVLGQRNAWLKSLQGASLPIGRDPWLTQLLDLGCQINRMRDTYLSNLSPLFAATLKQLSPDLGVDLRYDWGGLANAEEAEKKLGESWSRDVKLGATHRGPHRADLRFTQFDQPVAETVSRGQAKLIASAAILAQAELLYRYSNKKSLFLIDDFGAELDAAHWRQFLQTLLGLQCQVIATSTEPLDKAQEWVNHLDQLQVFHVEQGVITCANGAMV